MVEPRLVFVGGESLWPLNGGVGLLRASRKRTVARLPIHGKPSTILREYPSIDAAVAEVAAEFPTDQNRSQFLAATRDDEWTAVFVSSYPHTDVAGYWLARAQLDVHCDYLCYQWVPAGPTSVPAVDRVKGSAVFVEYRYARATPRLGFGGRNQPPAERVIQASDQGSRWEFVLVGEARPYEQTEYYERPRKADRLPLSLIEAYLAACGIPVDQRDWLAGPVTAVIRQGRGSNRVWSSPADLRARLGYPADGIPTTLTHWSTHG
jgi:hypothetical protein